MPTGMGEEERFAAAVEHGTTSGPARDGHGGADFAARDLEIVALLRAGGPALAPDPAARRRAKQRLMAAFSHEFGPGVDHGVDAGTAGEIAPDGATESTGPLQVLAPVALATRRTPARHAEPTPLRYGGRHSAPEPVDEPVDEPVEEPDVAEVGEVRRLRARPRAEERGGHRRAAVLGAAAAAALVALAGTGTFASQDALPGDSMYGIKRVAESTGLAMTFGEQAKARRHLEQAQRRLDEVQGMVSRDRTVRASGTAQEGSDPELVRNTMREFDTDTQEGSRLLLAGPKPDDAKVDEVRTWATQQSERLSELRSTLPAPDRADESLALLDRLLGETAALQGCDPTSTGSADVACVPSGSSTSTDDGTDSEQSATTDGERSSAGTSGTARHGGRNDADTDVNGSADTDPDGGSAAVRTSSRATSRSDDEDDRQRRGDGGGPGDSGGAGGSEGSDDVSVPLRVPLRVPSTAGLPGVNLGGN